MADPAIPPDPVDKAYAQAEAILADDAARAARRARVLAAVADEAAAPPGPTRRSGARHGRWLVAAGVVGLGVFIATQFPQAPVDVQPTKPPPPLAAAAPTQTTDAPAPEAAASVVPPAPTPVLPPPKAATAAEPQADAAMAPSAANRADQVAPPVAKATPVVGGFHGATAIGGRFVAPPPPPPPAPLAFAAPPPPPPAAMPANLDERSAPAPNPADRLRAAAAAGRAAEVKALLGQGVPADVPDADGETALMKSIQADQPAIAALLRRRGASLDRKNHAGQSARDMATAIDDPALNRAIGVGP